MNLDEVPGRGGVVWSAPTDGFHTNLVALEPDGVIGAHRNGELDVLFVVLAGGATLTVDGTVHELGPHDAELVAKGADRGVVAGPDGVRYLTVHARRRPMLPR